VNPGITNLLDYQAKIPMHTTHGSKNRQPGNFLRISRFFQENISQIRRVSYLAQPCPGVLPGTLLEGGTRAGYIFHAVKVIALAGSITRHAVKQLERVI
jgi:hypothetical protein